MQDKRPRSYGVAITALEDCNIKGVEFDPKRGILRPIGYGDEQLPVVSNFTEASYQGLNKKKIIAKVHPINNSVYYTDPDTALSEYDYIFSIDTNTKHINENLILSISSIGRLFYSKGGQFSFDIIACLELRNAFLDPEEIGIRFFITNYISRNHILQNKTVAIITDHNLGLMGDINARKSPLINDEQNRIEPYYIPENVKLAYARDSTRTEFAMNLAIAKCHDLSREFIEYMSKNEFDDVFLWSGTQTGALRYRLWIKYPGSNSFYPI